MAGVLIVLLLGVNLNANIAPEEIRRVVQEYLETRATQEQREVLVEYRSLPTTPVETMAYRLNVGTHSPPGSQGNLLLPIEVESSGTIIHRFTISVKVRTFGRVVVAARQIDRHEVLDSHMVNVQRMETTALPPDVLTFIEMSIGKRSTRMMRSGTAMTHGMLEEIPLVSRNNIVVVRVQSGPVTVAMQGRAREDGRRGEIIAVQRLNSRVLLNCKVIDERTVELNVD